MLNRMNGRHELERVDMLIRALSDEMAAEQAHTLEGTQSTELLTEMQDAIYELRLRKLLFSAFDSEKATHH